MALLPEVNLTLSAIRNALEEISNDLGTLCQSVNINKWGLSRFFCLGSNSANRLANIQSSPYKMGDFRAYNHNETAPGMIGSFIELFNGSSGTQQCQIRSIGDYSIKRYVRYDGGSWQLLSDDAVSWFNVVFSSGNHSVVHNSGSGQVEGPTINTVDNYHVLEGNLSVTVDEWNESQFNQLREYRVMLNHPDKFDGEALPYDIIGEQHTVVVELNVSPSGLDFFSQQNSAPTGEYLTISSECSLGGTYIEITKQDVSGHGTNWFTLDESNINIGATVDRLVLISAWNVSSGTRTGKIIFKIKDASSNTLITKEIGIEHMILQ